MAIERLPEYPVRSYAAASWIPPLEDNPIVTHGRWYDRYFVDPRDDSRVTDIGAPPTVGEAFWRESRLSNITIVPELRGAILSPKRIHLDPDLYLTPMKSGSLRLKGQWYDKEEEPDEPWRSRWHEGMGVKIALFSPQETAEGLLDPRVGTIQTRNREPINRSWIWWYQLAAPPVYKGEETPPLSGIIFYMGIRYGIPQWALFLPRPHPDYDDSGDWQLWQVVGTQGGVPIWALRDKIRQPSGGGSTQAASPMPQWISLLNIVGRGVILHSDLEKSWLYTPPGGFVVREGYMAAMLWNCRGWVSPGWVLYPQQAQIMGPWAEVPSWVTLDGEAHMRALVTSFTNPSPSYDVGGDAYYTSTYWTKADEDGDPAPGADPESATTMPSTGSDGTSAQGSRWGRPKVTVSNLSTEEGAHVRFTSGNYYFVTGCRYTPLLLCFQEGHRTVIDNRDPQPLDLTPHILEFSASFPDAGRGATATLRLRNYRTVAGNPGKWDPDSRGFLDDLLVGEGRIQIQAGHQYGGEAVDLWEPGEEPVDTPQDRALVEPSQDDALTALFTGYVVSKEAGLDAEGLWPELTLQLQDRTFLWQDGKAPMIFLPDLGGWDFKEAASLVLQQFGVRVSDTHANPVAPLYPSEVIFPEDYDSYPVRIRSQETSATLKFDPTTSAVDALDRICELVGYRWRIRQDGKIAFRWGATFQEEPDLVIDEADAASWTLGPLDVEEAQLVEGSLRATKDYAQARTVTMVVGIDKWGRVKEAIYSNGAALTDTTAPDFVGRYLWDLSVEPDNAAPDLAAQLRHYENAQWGQTVEWTSVGRPLDLGMIVQVKVSHLGVPLGTYCVVVSKSISLTASEGQQEPPLWREGYVVQPLPMGGGTFRV